MHNSQAKYLDMAHINNIGFAYIIDSFSDGVKLKTIVETLITNKIPYRGFILIKRKSVEQKIRQQMPDLLRNQNLALAYKKRVWLGLKWVPAIDKKDIFNTFEMDLFISFNSNNDKLYAYIAQKRVKAKMKVGMKHSDKCNYTLILQGRNGATLTESEYLQEIFHYTSAIEGEN